MTPARKRFHIRTARQLRVLSSPDRLEILEALRELGEATAHEIAERLGRQPGGVHYHLRQLQDIGVVRAAGELPAARQPQIVFAAVASDIILDPARLTPAFREEKMRAGRLLLRRAQRDLMGALERGVDDRIPGDAARITREVARLSAKDLAKIRRLLEEVERTLREADSPSSGQRVALTVVLAGLGEATRPS